MRRLAGPVNAVHGAEGPQQQRQHTELHRVLEDHVAAGTDAQVVQERIAWQVLVHHRQLHKVLQIELQSL